MATTTPAHDPLGLGSPVPSDAAPDLSEEEASQGHKTGHMRWVLGIGFALACVTLATVAVLH